MTTITLLPENAVVENHGDLKTTSLKVAEAFGKRHDNVLRTLDNLECSQEFNALNFEAVDYIDQKGQFRKAYQMTKDGFMFLVMGFTGNQLPNHTYPNFYDSGWIPALYRRCQSETHWTYHIKFNVRPKGGKFAATFELGIGGKGNTAPNFSSSGSQFVDSNFYLEYRDLNELWEYIAKVLAKYGARCPF
jgi:Rha family phage regulatory protein